jgi:hypothetical protein
VMAMKLVDLLELAVSGNYLDSGTEIPLPIELRIARISLTSGLIAPAAGGSINQLMGRWRNRLRAPTGLDRGVAFAVAKVAGDLKLLRLDSLAWQLAEAAGTPEWESDATKRLIAAGSPSARLWFAAELDSATKIGR